MAAANHQDPITASRVTIAALEARVHGLDVGQQDIKRTVLDLDSKIDQSITTLATRFESSLGSLTNKIEARSTTQWPTIFAGMGVLCTILIALGTALYVPIQRDTSRLDFSVNTVVERGVFQREYSADQIRVADTLRALRADVNANIQQQRYNVDQDRLTKNLESIRSDIEAIRMRTYDMHGRMSKSEQFESDLDRRYDAISNRLAQHIRDYLQQMKEMDRGARPKQ